MTAARTTLPAGRLRELTREAADLYPFYRELGLGSDPEFRDFPIMDKTTIADNRARLELPGSGASGGASSRGLTESFTSGSTGVPFRCVKNAAELQALSLAIYRCRRRFGLPLRHRSVLLSNRLLAEPPLLDHYARRIAREAPQLIQGRSSALYELAGHIERAGLAVPAGAKLVQNWGEPLQPGHRERIERVFGAPFADFYGMEELWLIAFSDERGRLAVDESSVYVEAVDPATGEPVPDGEFGEILVTSFLMRSLPFIRYRTGDAGCLERDAATGRTFIRLAPMRQSQIKLPGRSAQSAIFRYLDKFFHDMWEREEIRQFQIVQQSYTSFLLRIVPARHGATEGGSGDRSAERTAVMDLPGGDRSAERAAVMKLPGGDRAVERSAAAAPAADRADAAAPAAVRTVVSQAVEPVPAGDGPELEELARRFAGLLRQHLSEDATARVECVDRIEPHPVSGKVQPFVTLVP